MSLMKTAKAGIAIIFLLFMVVLTTVAQPVDPSGDPDVPITGIEILLGMGGLYGAKKFLDLRKKK